jgi:hypothetical protein
MTSGGSGSLDRNLMAAGAKGQDLSTYGLHE